MKVFLLAAMALHVYARCTCVHNKIATPQKRRMFAKRYPLTHVFPNVNAKETIVYDLPLCGNC